MKKYLSSTLKVSIVSLAYILSATFNSYAENNRIDLRVEGDIGGQYNSNLAQINGFDGDFINSYTATGTLRYLAPSQTQVLARVQGQYNKFIKRSEFDVLAFAGSLNISQWFFNSLNVYVGLQPIQLVSTSTSRKPFDMVYLGGLTYYYPFDSNIAFAGYQIDKLNASAQDFSALNNTFLVGIRHAFADNLYGNASARVRLRNLDLPTIPDDTRIAGNVSAQYLINQWLTLQVSGEYTQINSASPDRTLGIFNLGVNIIGGYNNSFNF